MSYLVCHVQKFKSSDVKGIQIHNQRESKNSKNKDIDPQKTKLNYDLHNPTPINYNKKVKEIIKEGYTGSKSIRKDAVVMNGVLISSDPKFFSNLSSADQKKFFNAAYEKVKDLYGEKNIVSAKVHMDETTPHMHVSLVPLIDGKLFSKQLFDRNSLRTLQDEMPKHLQSMGFKIERGEIGSENKHVDPEDYKRQEREKAKMEMDKNIKALESELKALRADFPREPILDALKPKKSLLGANMTLKEGEYESLVRIAKQGDLMARLNDVLKHKTVNQDADIDKLFDEVQKLRSEVKDLTGQKTKILDRVEKFKGQAKFLSDFLDEHDLLDEAKEVFLKKELIKEKEIESTIKPKSIDVFER